MNGSRTRQEYFEELSGRWDGFTDGERVKGALRDVLSMVPIKPDEHVVDLGCGTGNLTSVLLEFLGPSGIVAAVDFSRAMLEVARGKIPDHRVRWVVADAAGLPLDNESADRIVCFSAWPHFPQPAAVARELLRVLRPGGVLHIVHIDSRGKVDAIHGGVGGAIGQDHLPPAHVVAQMLTSVGFSVFEQIDSETEYRIRAGKVA